MSGIVGVYYLDGRPVCRTDLERMSLTLAHRGRDGAGLWTEGSVGFGHRLLWTTPESVNERLPVTSTNGDIVLTADARIDNRDELIDSLGLTNHASQEITDSELILAAYEKWGEQSPKQLLGDFAFSLWDRRRHRLFCARDPVGVKPFYYYQSSHSFVFASEIKALFCLREVPRRLNEVRVADHLVESFADQTNTFYRDIFRLPAGHSMTINPGAKRVRPYWTFDPKREVLLRSSEEYAEAFRGLFTEAVRCRLRSAFRVGSTLSGGLDSSSIVCTARKLLSEKGQQHLHTFSAVFPSLPETDLRKIDERPFIDAVVAMGGVEPHYVHADLLSPLTDIDQVHWHEDEAILAPNLYMHWALYKAALSERVRIFLDGIDGDTTVSHGLEYLAELARTGRWGTLAKEATALSGKVSASFTPRRIIWEYGFRPLMPDSAVQIWRWLHGRKQPLWAANTVISPSFARRIGLEERARALVQKESGPVRTARENHWRGLTSTLIPYALESLDKAAAAFSLEPRYPFFDRRLMEFCLALPPEQKLHQGWTRVVMRRAMAGILPPEVQWRTRKANLSANFKRKLLDYDRSTLEKVILKQPQVIEEYVDVPALQCAYHRYTRHPIEREQEALTVYGAVTLACWLGLTTQSRPA